MVVSEGRYLRLCLFFLCDANLVNRPYLVNMQTRALIWSKIGKKANTIELWPLKPFNTSKLLIIDLFSRVRLFELKHYLSNFV